MPRKSTIHKELEAIISDVTFSPEPKHRMVKSAFWATVADNPLYNDHLAINAAQVAYVTGDGRVSKWWSQEGFPAWFLNTEEFNQKKAYIAHLALDRLSDILSDPDTKESSMVAAIKLAMELDDRMPSKKETEYADAAIGNMDVKQLEDFISKRTLTIKDKSDGSTDEEETHPSDDIGDSV